MRDDSSGILSSKGDAETYGRLRAIFDVLPTTIMVWSEDVCLLETNHAAKAFFGLKEDEDVVVRFDDLSPPHQPNGRKSREYAQEYVRTALTEGSFVGEWQHRNVAGEMLPTEVSLFRIEPEGCERLVVACLRDLREIREEQKKVFEADERVRIMLDTAPMAITMWDEGGNMIDCNMEAVRLLEVEAKAEFIDNFFRFCPELQPDGESSREKGMRFTEEAFKKGFLRFEWLYLTAHGEPLPTETTLVRVPWKDGFRLASYSRDLRESKKLLAGVEEALKAAQEADHAKSEFLARMSHEIRTPMNAILGTANIMLHGDLPPDIREDVLSIRHEGSSLLRIINDILDFSKIESGKMEIVSADYYFASFINDIVSLTRIRAAERDLLFTVDVDPNIPRRLHGDMIRVRQVALNLLTNAIKYTPEGHVSLIIEAERERANECRLIVTVTDTGMGIKEEDLRNLFHEFTRLDTQRNYNVVGSGLGLVIAEGLTRQMGGYIRVTSKYGEGSTFKATMMQRVVDATPSGVVEHAERKSMIVFGPRALYRASISRSAKRLGVHIETAESVDFFAEKLQAGDFAYAFIASVMQEEGVECLKKISPHTEPVIMTEVGSLPPSNMKSIGIPLDAISIANLLNGRKSANVFEEDTDGKPNFGAPGAKILVVDDLSTNLAVVVGLLRLYDVHADTAQSGQDAINSMQRKDYDLVFMDHMMPGMDGVEAVRRIRSLGGNCGNVPVVALTANAMIGMREFFIQHGFNDFISKPIEPEKLQTALIKWLPPQLRIAKKGD